MTQRIKSLIIVIVVSLIIIAVTVGLVLFFTQRDYMKVNSLADYDFAKVSDFDNSRLYLHGNGTFTVYVTRGKDEHIFTGIGTFTKDGNTYKFTYVDAWVRADSGFIRDNADKYIGKTHNYSAAGNGIEFIDDNQRRYYFGY